MIPEGATTAGSLQRNLPNGIRRFGEHPLSSETVGSSPSSPLSSARCDWIVAKRGSCLSAVVSICRGGERSESVSGRAISWDMAGVPCVVWRGNVLHCLSGAVLSLAGKCRRRHAYALSPLPRASPLTTTGWVYCTKAATPLVAISCLSSTKDYSPQ